MHAHVFKNANNLPGVIARQDKRASIGFLCRGENLIGTHDKLKSKNGSGVLSDCFIYSFRAVTANLISASVMRHPCGINLILYMCISANILSSCSFFLPAFIRLKRCVNHEACSNN